MDVHDTVKLTYDEWLWANCISPVIKKVSRMSFGFFWFALLVFQIPLNNFLASLGQGMNWFQFALVMVLETTIYGHYTSLTLQDPSATVNPRKKYVDDIPNLLPGLEGPVASAAAGGVDEAEDMEVA